MGFSLDGRRRDGRHLEMASGGPSVIVAPQLAGPGRVVVCVAAGSKNTPTIAAIAPRPEGGLALAFDDATDEGEGFLSTAVRAPGARLGASVRCTEPRAAFAASVLRPLPGGRIAAAVVDDGDEELVNSVGLLAP